MKRVANIFLIYGAFVALGLYGAYLPNLLSFASDALNATIQQMNGLSLTTSRTAVMARAAPNICIITAISGNYKAKIKSIDHLNLDGYVFGDGSNVEIEGSRWIRDDTRRFNHHDPFMRAKFYKTQWHTIERLEKYDVVVWIDATIKVKREPPIPPIDSIITYHHQVRNSTHQEIAASKDVRYTMYAEGLSAQRKERTDVPWLAVTCWVVNCRGPRVYEMNDLWFHDIVKYSPQDQVSFPFACETAHVPVELLNDGTSHRETKYYNKGTHLTKYADYRK